MAFTVVLWLTILSIVNFGNTFEFSGLNHASQIKTQHKPVIKSFHVLNNKPQLHDQIKSASFGFKNAAVKPFGTPFDSFKPAYQQQYQPGTFKENYQPFGPYPGYPGPVIYSGQGSYPGPTAYPTPTPYSSLVPYPSPAPFNQPAAFSHPPAYPQPTYRYDGPDHNSCGFQHFSPPPAVQSEFNPFKYGPTKKFNKIIPGQAEFNVPGKYFQEHQLGAYHVPEFFSAVVPHEHQLKYSKPSKEFISSNPFAPTDKVKSSFPSFPSGFQLPNFPKIEHAINTVSPTKNEQATDVSKGIEIVQSATLDSSPATPQSPIDVIPEGPSHEGAIATEVTSNNDVPAADDNTSTQQKDDTKTDSVSELVPAQISDSQVNTANIEQSNSVPVDDAKPISDASTTESPVSPSDLPIGNDESSITNQSPVSEENIFPSQTPVSDESIAPSQTPVLDESIFSSQNPVSEENIIPSQSPISDESVFSSQTPVADINSVSDKTSSTSLDENIDLKFGGQISDSSKSSSASKFEVPVVKSEQVKNEAKLTDSITVNASPSLPDSSLFGFGPASDPTYLSSVFASSGYPDFSGFHKQLLSSYYPTTLFDMPVQFTNEELKKAYKEQFGMDLPQDGKFFVGGPSTPASGSTESLSIEKSEKTSADQTSKAPELTKKNEGAVQIIQEDPLKGQLPLYDTRNLGAPFSSFNFYRPPAVSDQISRASQIAYSPDQAFTSFGSQYQPGSFLIQGSPSLKASAPGTVLQADQTPISISSPDHPMHSQVFKYSQSFVPYPQAVSRSLSDNVPTPSSTVAPVADDKATEPTAAAVDDKVAATVSDSDAKITSSDTAKVEPAVN